MVLRLAKKLVKGSLLEPPAHWVYTEFAARFASEEVRRSIRYDRETTAVMRRVLRRDSNCVDVGCHLGFVLKEMLRVAPEGVHYAFEPLPDFYQHLVNSYPAESYPNIRVYELALSEVAGETSFQNVVTRPAYSGLEPRRYDHEDVCIEQIKVRTDLLDNVIPPRLPIRFIKIDVEGAELQVLKGAVKTIRRNKPVVVFEHGLGASDHYGTTPEDVHDLLVKDCGLHVSLLGRWLRNEGPLTKEEFSNQYYQRLNFFFMAY
jgi:FkbM family methyltransferase